MDCPRTVGQSRLNCFFIFVISLVLFLTPVVSEANPYPVPMFISEFSVDSASSEKIELFIWDNGYGLENLDGFYVQTNTGTFPLINGIVVPDTGYVVLSDSSCVDGFHLSDASGYVDIFDQYDFSWDHVEYGTYPQSMVPAPLPGQSVSARIELGEYGYYHDYFYIDGTPTFGAENDTQGSLGHLEGTVTDSAGGWPVQGASVETSHGGFATTNASGLYSLDVISGYQTVIVSAAEYKSDTSSANEVCVLIDSTVTYDVELRPAAGVRPGDGAGPSLPGSFSLSQNYPNPFNPSTTITYDVKLKSHVSIWVFDTRGRLIRKLVDEEKESGSYSVEWNGRDDPGRSVSSGVYLYVMKIGETIENRRKMILLK